MNVSVPEYVFMQEQYGMGRSFGPLSQEKVRDEEQGPDVLGRTQAAIELAVERAGGPAIVLAIDEVELSHLSTIRKASQALLYLTRRPRHCCGAM
jgi:hypothetical protein